MDRITIGIGVSSIGRFLPFIGKAAGLFEKKNISVEVLNQQDEEKVVDDLVTQLTPVGTPNAPSLIFSVLDGNDLVIVGGILNRPAFYLVADATLSNVADLKGKRVGINQPRRMAGMVMIALLRKWNLDSQRDLRLIDLGLNDKSLEALRSRQIDAALLPPEKAFLAEEEGFSVIADSGELDYHWVPLATTRKFLRANRGLATRIAEVYAESIGLFRSQPAETLAELSRWLPALRHRPELLKKCYDVFALRFDPSLTPSMKSLASILNEVALQDPRARAIKAESLVEKVI
jgi:ABC-type nitrate/sulfonate/bicarbonate transport system substrate-binding protein